MGNVMDTGNKDIRWIQRFFNYNKALSQLSKFIDKQDLNELEEQGLIQCFEYTHELAWNTIKDFLESRGKGDIFGSKDATREAFGLGLIEEGEIWMDMIQSRNQTTHTYNEDTAGEIARAIRQNYYRQFISLQKRFADLAQKERDQ
jgi:nucleotidyltransferase substrate binding protein (TIGR01987 family)